jgi:hypothetical protein
VVQGGKKAIQDEQIYIIRIIGLAAQEVATVEVGKSWQKCEVDERLAKVVEASCRRATVIVGHRSDCM